MTIRGIKFGINQLRYLLKLQAPLIAYLKLIESKLAKKRRAGYTERRNAFKNSLADKKLLHDWFTHNILPWYDAFYKSGIDPNKKYNILEIGSFEGLSSLFLLQTFLNSTVTCVDAWIGADLYSKADMHEIEDNFDFNTSPYKDRLIKYKGTSSSFFEKCDIYNPTYDIIYVDGSHFADDVLVDGLRCCSMLKNGGIIIFDDYFWSAYREKSANPAAAINTLIKMKSKVLKVKSVYNQVVLTKVASESHEVLQVLA